MKQFSNYAEAKESAKYEGGSQLPEGGYVCKILATKYTEPKDGNSGRIDLQIDVIEGDYKDFFRKQYEGNTSVDKKWKGKATIWEPKDDGSEKDGWTKNRFARWTNAIEDSNPGYTWDWDESKWKGKIVGVVYGKVGTVIDGKEIIYTEASVPVAVEKIRSGDFKLPKFRAKGGYTGTGSGTGSGSAPADDSMFVVTDADPEEIPF